MSFVTASLNPKTLRPTKTCTSSLVMVAWATANTWVVDAILSFKGGHRVGNLVWSHAVIPTKPQRLIGHLYTPSDTGCNLRGFRTPRALIRE